VLLEDNHSLGVRKEDALAPVHVSQIARDIVVVVAREGIRVACVDAVGSVQGESRQCGIDGLVELASRWPCDGGRCKGQQESCDLRAAVSVIPGDVQWNGHIKEV
jgi:hypothetical protein